MGTWEGGAGGNWSLLRWKSSNVVIVVICLHCLLFAGRRWWREDIAAALQEPLSSGVEKDLCASILDLL